MYDVAEKLSTITLWKIISQQTLYMKKYVFSKTNNKSCRIYVLYFFELSTTIYLFALVKIC